MTASGGVNSSARGTSSQVTKAISIPGRSLLLASARRQPISNWLLPAIIAVGNSGESRSPYVAASPSSVERAKVGAGGSGGPVLLKALLKRVSGARHGLYWRGFSTVLIGR